MSNCIDTKTAPQSYWRVTHVTDSGVRQRVRVRASGWHAAMSEAEKHLGPAVGMAAIRISGGAV